MHCSQQMDEESDCRSLWISDWVGTQSLTDFSWESLPVCWGAAFLCILCILSFSVFFCIYISLYLRVGLPPRICSWILPLTLLPLCIHFPWALWTWNCADIWVRPKCLKAKIHSISSGSDSLFLVPIGKPWASLQPASLGGWQPKDECDSLLSPVTVAALPVSSYITVRYIPLSRKPLYTCWAIRTFQGLGFFLGILTNDHWLYQLIHLLCYEYFYFIL